MSTAALRPRSASEIVDAAFQILRASYGQFVICSAIGYLPLLVFRLVVGDPRRFLFGADIATLGRGLQWTAAEMLVSTLTLTAMSAVLIVCASQAYLGDEVDVAAAVRRALPRLGAVLVAGFLRLMLLALAFVLFIFPGFYAVARYFAVTPVVMLEDAGVGRAFSRSSLLSKQRKWHILNTFGLVAIIYYILVLGISLAVALVGNYIVQVIVSSVVVVLAFPVVAITEALLYYDARIQSEGLDIELMTDALAGGPLVQGSVS